MLPEGLPLLQQADPICCLLMTDYVTADALCCPLQGANGMMGSMMPGAGMMTLNGQAGSSHMGSMMPMMAQHHHTNGLMPGACNLAGWRCSGSAGCAC